MPWTEPTTDYWQRFESPASWRGRLEPPYRFAYPALVDAGRMLSLPIRPLPASRPETGPDGEPRAPRAVASFIGNQASVHVVDELARAMGDRARTLRPDVVVGLPTLGMCFAPGVVRRLGQERYVPLGYSRKYWYDDALATHVSSVTSLAAKTVYLDPNQLRLVRGRRVAIVDDVVSTARTLTAVWELLESLEADGVGAVVAMRQAARWPAALGTDRAGRVLGVFDSPGLALGQDGWWPE